MRQKKYSISWASYLLVTLLLGNVASASTDLKNLTYFDEIVAVVNNDIITKSRLKNRLEAVKRQLKQRQVNYPSEKLLEKQVLERMIDTQLQLQLAANRGIGVDDSTLNQTINNIASDNNMSLSKFKTKLETDGYNFLEFKDDIRNEITIKKLQGRLVASTVTVTRREVEQFIAQQKNSGQKDISYHISHILISLPEAPSPTIVTAKKERAQQVIKEAKSGADFKSLAITYSDGQKALEGGDLGWRKAGQLPSFFAKAVNTLKTGEISPPIRSPSGFHIIKLVEKKGIKRHISQQLNARHILIKNNELLTGEELEKKITDIKAQLDDGASFSELAAKYSEDTGSKTSGGKLGWVNPNDMVPKFKQKILSLKINEISKPFKSRFGWHIAEVTGKRDLDDTEEFENNRAHAMLHQIEVEKKTATWLRNLRAEAYVDIRKSY